MTKAMYTGQDKRHFQRSAQRTAARVVAEDTRTLEGKCSDISRGGLLLELTGPLTQGSVVDLTLIDPHSGNLLMSSRARVARCKKSAHGHYTVGLTLLEQE